MTENDLAIAEKLLKPYIDRVERAPAENSTWCLQAHWSTGGHTGVSSLEAVKQHVADFENRKTKLGVQKIMRRAAAIAGQHWDNRDTGGSVAQQLRRLATSPDNAGALTLAEREALSKLADEIESR